MHRVLSKLPPSFKIHVLFLKLGFSDQVISRLLQMVNLLVDLLLFQIVLNIRGCISIPPCKAPILHVLEVETKKSGQQHIAAMPAKG